ncbi:MAG: DNA polymerase III subunit alpha [Candidatus Marinimicrobia bacterium]|jgi:DNA polymerase-3 subunit alpha|nr:DNA polymerase III subunit alpha [Candidatus Neomarinimicrobiota bacterium]
MKNSFVHLHTHSHYSLLNALPKIPDLVEAAIENEMPALALTDNGNLYGAIEFYKACKSKNVKPIIGVDAYVAPRTRHDKESRIDNRTSRLVLLSKNEKGYRNLLKSVTKANLEGFYYKPRVDRELLEEFSDEQIAILPSFASEVSKAIRENDEERARETIDWYKKVFGKDNVYLEITHHPEIDGHQNLMESIKKFAKETKTPLVAAHDSYYIKPADRLARETMVKIQTSAALDRDSSRNEDFSFISNEEANKFFKDTPEALQNTIDIAETCDLEIELGKWVFPDFKLPKGETADSALRKLAESGISKKGLKKSKELKDRLDYELKIIKDKGYSPYFLVVGDLMRFAHEKKILTTIRGSVAGSLTTYLSEITNVDPLEYQIPFERFLNPDRPSPPDIDMDFADNRRDEVIQYAREKYGEDRVAQIGTFGTMMARAAVRDVARALGHPYGLGDRIAKIIPFGSQGFPMTIDRAMEIMPDLRELYKKERDVKEIIDLAKSIEGCARHISVHAAGVVIAPTALEEYVPLQFDPKGGKKITQYDMYAVEDAGLLKFDFLGIKNLAILSDAVRRVRKIRNVEVNIEDVKIDDKKTFESLARGETMGLFQLNGSGMTHFLKELRPSSIHDINVMVALYRPGPMQFIPQYIERKHNPNLISYLDPAFEKILNRTNGILVYQDDLLIMAHDLAGYSWKEVDKFRKAVGKKIPAEMAAQKEKFIKGCMKTSKWDRAKAERIWKWIEPFAAYGFNKAHSVSYGKVAYQTAYMKTNFPVEYMSAVLTADAGDVEKIAEGINECKRMDIAVLPPDINESFGDFSVVPGELPTIRFGLYSIKNFGEGIADSIIQERKDNGKYTSIANLLERVQDKNLNRKSLESLIKSGALDQFEERGTMLSNIEMLLSYSKEFADLPDSQDSLFGALPQNDSSSTLVLPKSDPISMDEKLLWERELLGLYISGHPLDKYREKLEKRSADIHKIKEELREGMQTVVSGIIEDARVILTKGGDQMAFLRIADFSDNVEVVIFPRLFTNHKDLLQAENCISIKGRLSARNGDTSIVAEAVKAL